MATTSYTDFTAGVREIAGRTDSAGTAVDDLPLDEDRLINHVLTEGYLSSGAFQVAADSPVSMDVIVGSGTAKADLYVVEGDDNGQHPYIVRLDDASITVTLDAADASNPRIDEIWLVVADATWDAGSVSLPRIGYRKGTAGASPAAPGADSAWKAAVKLATITVSAGATSVGSGDIADNRSPATADVPNLLGSVEVDGSTEVASYSTTTSYANAAAISLTIPTDWNSWKCTVWASFAYSATDGDQISVQTTIDGTAQQAQENLIGVDPDASTNKIRSGSVVGRRTGVTSTGSVTVALQAKESGGTAQLTDICVYARAVRTS